MIPVNLGQNGVIDISGKNGEGKIIINCSDISISQFYLINPINTENLEKKYSEMVYIYTKAPKEDGYIYSTPCETPKCIDDISGIQEQPFTLTKKWIQSLPPPLNKNYHQPHLEKSLTKKGRLTSMKKMKPIFAVSFT